MDNIEFAAILPHPPILIPEVGKESIKIVQKSQDALKLIAKQIKNIEKELDCIIVVTPHGLVSGIYTSLVFEGSLANFGVPQVKLQLKGCPEFANELVKEAGDLYPNTSETKLDHGIIVPLYYPLKEKIDLPVLPIAISFLPLEQLFEFGKKIKIVAERLNKKVALIASADMSHCLTKNVGKEFDKKLVELVKNNDVKGILEFPADLAEAAGQDALWSIAILLGALDNTNSKPEVLSYEGPFGVGYMVVNYACIS